MTQTRHHNDGLRKICRCPRRKWSDCRHPWHFNFTWNGQVSRFSLDRYVGRRIPDRTSAETEADRVRTQIRAGTFQLSPAALVPSVDVVTLDRFGETFVDRWSKARNKASWKGDRLMLQHVGAFVPAGSDRRLGLKAIGAITEDELELFIEHLRACGRAASTRNQYVQVLKAAFRWATRKGYISRTPITEDSALKREKHARRNRRILPDEEATLLAAAPARLYRVIVAALETGARLGELLSLQWRDVDRRRDTAGQVQYGPELRIRAEHAKDAELRHIPISTRLAAVLDMARLNPAGTAFGPDDYVFGDEVGARLTSLKKTWETAVLKAHGHTPIWTNSALAPESRTV